MRRRKILILTKLFWPEGSGAELATYLIVKDILAKYFDVTIVSGTKKPHLNILRNCKYIFWEVLLTKHKPLEWLKLTLNTHLVKKLVEKTNVVYIPSHTLLPLAIAIKRFRPCTKVVLHLHNYQPITYTAVVLTNGDLDAKNDIIFERYEHGSIARAIATGLLRITNKINTLALYYADEVICVSRRQAELISRNLPELAPKIMVIYNPIPEFSPSEGGKFEKPTFTYAGGGSYVKGFHIFIQAALKLLKQKRYVNFMLTGGLRGYRYYLKLLEKLNKQFTESFKLFSRLPYEDVLKLYSKSYAVLVPSIWEEPLPYVVMEAMAVGTIPIASRIGGIPEIVRGTYAERMMFTRGDPEDMADRIEEILSMPKEHLIDIGYQLREAALKKFNRETVKRKLLKIFEA